MVQVCDNNDAHTLLSFNHYLTAVPESPPTDRSILRFREIIDPRFTDMSKVAVHTVEVTPYEPTKLSVHVAVRPGVGAHFNAVYLLWWEEGNTPRLAASPYPSRTQPPEHLPLCDRKPELPQCNEPFRATSGSLGVIGFVVRIG
jgi:hypothetical protein